jgi:hypothetical protein
LGTIYVIKYDERMRGIAFLINKVFKYILFLYNYLDFFLNRVVFMIGV